MDSSEACLTLPLWTSVHRQPRPQLPQGSNADPKTQRNKGHLWPTANRGMPQHGHRARAAADSDWVDYEGIFEDYELGPPFKFQKPVINDCDKKATSRSTLAVQLVII